MKERPILFTGPMVRAILDGSKTQTRRVVTKRDGGETLRPLVGYNPDRIGSHYRCPYGQPGDLLYVRETWGEFRRRPGVPVYRADDPHALGASNPWRPSIHMPKRFARLWLRVTGVRVERVQEISGPDILAEGVDVGPGTMLHGVADYSLLFADLWNSINAKRGYGWDANPWVWVVEFDKAER